MKAKNKLIVQSIQTEKEAKSFMFLFVKKTYQRWKAHWSNGFCRREKFIIANFYEMDFMKGVVILEKVDEMYKFLNSLLAYCFCSRDESDIFAIHLVVFIKTFHIALIPDSWIWSIVGNHSNFRNYWFHAKHSHKHFVETRLVFVRVEENQGHVIWRRNCWKVPVWNWFLYLHVTLFRMHVEI